MSTTIKLQHLTKKFVIPHERKSTVLEHIAGMLNMNMSYERFTALDDISLEIGKGEFIGLIGENGSGKSTLLKIIARILIQTSGDVHTRGKIASFLELGVGFQEDLTARENVYLYGIMMGMTKKEMERKYRSIVEFSGVKRFMDAKLKTLSSGMIVRLAFSTAIHTDPDILILDEILAVGDERFQKKCHSIFNRFREEKKTIILASHDISLIKRYCTKTIYLEKGRMEYFGDTVKAVSRYERSLHNNQSD